MLVLVSNDSLIDTPTKFIADSGNNVGNYATFNWSTPVGRLHIQQRQP